MSAAPTPSRVETQRCAHASDSGSSSLMSYARLAAAIKDYHSVDEVFCTRLVAQTVQHSKSVATDADIDWFYQAPESTGDARWDALIQGVAVHTWALSGRPGVPHWTMPLRPIQDWWEPGHMPERWRFWNLVHTPASIRERRVIFPASWLEAV